MSHTYRRYTSSTFFPNIILSVMQILNWSCHFKKPLLKIKVQQQLPKPGIKKRLAGLRFPYSGYQLFSLLQKTMKITTDSKYLWHQEKKLLCEFPVLSFRFPEMKLLFLMSLSSFQESQKRNLHMKRMRKMTMHSTIFCSVKIF